MNINFRNAELKDKEFIFNANREINILSGLNDSTSDNNIDKGLFEDKICKVIIAENEVMMKSLNKLNFKSSDLITYYRKTKEEI